MAEETNANAVPKKKMGLLKIGCLTVAGIFVGLFVIGLAVGPNSKPAAVSGSAAASVAVVEVTAAELSKAFQGNEAKAKLAYDGKPLRVSGVVKDIDLDFMDNPQIKLKGSGDVQGMGISQGGKMTDVTVGGLSKEQAAKIDKGQQLSVTCQKIDEMMGGPVVTECAL